MSYLHHKHILRLHGLDKSFRKGQSLPRLVFLWIERGSMRNYMSNTFVLSTRVLRWVSYEFAFIYNCSLCFPWFDVFFSARRGCEWLGLYALSRNSPQGRSRRTLTINFIKKRFDGRVFSVCIRTTYSLDRMIKLS